MGELKECEKIIENCTECGLCVEECEFLKQNCDTPKELAERFEQGYFREKPIIPYSCNLCDLCKEVCPLDLNLGDMFLEIRQEMVEEGLAPLPQHQLIQRQQEWVTSPAFTLTRPDLSVRESEKAFFPGCSLCGYSPSLVIKTYDYLRQKLPGTGIILGCCGAPTRDLGQQAKFQAILGTLKTEMDSLGASELLIACPQCFHTIKHNAPDIKLTSIYEVMTERGLPETTTAISPQVFSLHDSCKSRYDKTWQETIRSLIKRMGYQVEEMEHSRGNTRCCGMGGEVSFVNLRLTAERINQRLDEARYDMLSSCAACREAFAFVREPSLHILDLIFNPEWEEDRANPAQTWEDIQENQRQLKAFYSQENAPY